MEECLNGRTCSEKTEITTIDSDEAIAVQRDPGLLVWVPLIDVLHLHCRTVSRHPQLRSLKTLIDKSNLRPFEIANGTTVERMVENCIAAS
jgi:hypothetical protein